VDRLIDSFIAQWHGVIELAPRALLALVVLFVFVFAGRLVGRGVGLVLKRGGLTPTHQLFFRRLVIWVAMLLGLAMALNLLGLGGVAAGLLAGGGLTAVVLGFAFRQIGENLLAGLFLAFSRPFNVDDYIESGSFQGTVRKIELRHTHIRTPDGRDIFIPNSQIFNSSLVNFTRDGLLRPSFTVGLDYRDDVAAACELLARVTAAVEYVLAEPPPQAHVSGLAASVVEIEVVYWVNTFADGFNGLRVKGEVMDRCREALLAGGFTVASEVTSRLDVEITRDAASPAG
jgi:small conductance mechanosensitive channel